MRSPLHRIPLGALAHLADSITSGRLAAPFSAISLQRYLPATQCEEIAAELQSLADAGVRSPQLAYILRLLADERSYSQRVGERLELVWTGPETPGSASRDTGVVVRELFSRAQSSVLIAGFAIWQGSHIFKSLADRMTQVPELVVRMFLNVPRGQDPNAPVSELLSKFVDSFRQTHWPWSKLPEVYYDPRSLEVDYRRRASLHAKCIIVDEERTFVTSANFTEAAQERNIEAGVLVKNAAFACALRDQFESLVASDALRRVPGIR